MNVLDTILQFRENAAHLCAPHVLPPYPATWQISAATIDRVLDDNKRAKKIWDSLKKDAGAHVVFLWGGGVATYADPGFVHDGKMYPLPGQVSIALDCWEDAEYLARAFLHEMRHVLQHVAGLSNAPRHASLFDEVWFARIMEADAESYNAIELFRLRLQGDDELFRCGRSGIFGGIYSAIEEMYYQDATTLDDGRLRRAAFDAWFSIPSVRMHYECQALKNYPTIKEWYEYFEKEGHIFPDTRLTAADLHVLGSLDGVEPNYLTLPGYRPLDHPYYRLDFASREMKKLWAEERAKNGQQSKNPLPKPR